MVAPHGTNGYLEDQSGTRGAFMIVIAAAVIGAILGWRRAGQLGGSQRDRAQYAAAFAVAFAVVGLFATVFVDRMM
ncbi:hypothetical protein [Paracoccus sp. (in: a-proteobacteria)]